MLKHVTECIKTCRSLSFPDVRRKFGARMIGRVTGRCGHSSEFSWLTHVSALQHQYETVSHMPNCLEQPFLDENRPLQIGSYGRPVQST